MGPQNNNSGFARLVALAISCLKLFLVSLVLLSLQPTIASAQTSATVAAQQDRGFGRLVFDFTNLPQYDVRVASNVLIIEFGEPISIALENAARNLDRYVSAGRVDPDRKAIRFALTRVVTVNTMEAGEMLFVDVLPENWRGLPPGLPADVVADLARRAEEAEVRARRQALEDIARESGAEVTVASGEHPTFSRISFTWNVPFGARLSREGDKLQVGFNQLAIADLKPLITQPPPGLLSASSDRTEKGLVITLEVERGVNVRAFMDGENYVVDLTNATNGFGGDLSLSNPDLDRPDVTQLPGAPDDISLADEAAPGQAQVETTEPTIETASLDFDPSVFEPQDYADWPQDQTVVAVDPKLPQVPVENGQSQLGSVAANPNEGPGTSAAANPDAIENPINAATARAEAVEGGIRITFDFPKPVRSAVFQRNGAIWAVFDSDTLLELGSLERQIASRVKRVDVIRSGTKQIVRMDLKAPSLTSVAGRDRSWLITIGDLVLDAPQPLLITRERGTDGLPQVLIDMGEDSRIHWLDDPVIGDRLAVVTAYGPARGLVKQQEFVEFVAFPSAHGLAIKPLADDLRVSLHLDEVVIDRNTGLWLSATGDVAAAREVELLARTRPGHIDFAKYLAGGTATYLANARKLAAEAAVADEELQTAARLELARFYLAHLLGVEALGVLQKIDSDGNARGAVAIVNALTGIANTLMGRAAEARRAFNTPGVGDGTEINLWLGLVEALDGNWMAAQEKLESGEQLIWEYPTELRARMHLAAARGALQRKDFEAANHHLAVLQDVDAGTGALAEQLFLRGRYMEEVGRRDLALNAYTAAIAYNVRPISIEARRHKIAMMLGNDMILKDDAVRQLEGMSMGWRGDRLELAVINDLADIYAKDSNFMRLFEVMRSASILDADNSVLEDLRHKIDIAFKELFLQGGADELPPIEALTLFYEHRVLTPIGREGDEIIRRLAERLVAVDLLEQAADLLTHQVDERLEGVARAHVAGRLAAIHLMNRNPAEAVRALRRTRLAEMPAEVRRQRQLLEARAYSESGRMELALDILSTMDGDDVERQKADTLWQARAWQSAAEQLERSLGETWKQGAPLTGDQRYNVMRAAVSYALANDELGLKRLRTKFAQLMSESPDSHGFSIVTGPISPDAQEFRDLAREIASVDTLQAFLDDIQSREFTPSSGDVPQEG